MNKLARLPAIDRARRASARQLRRVRRPKGRYFAFLSYSHKDEELAEWLHWQLEQFRVPRTLVGQLTENGTIPKRLTPIFRDQHELAAADDLSDEIEEALRNSRFLIVLCSPDAAKSKWTNAEIETFKRTRPDGFVLAAIAAGEPFASDMPGREAEECFPPALRQKYDRRGHPTGKRAEPLAADLREQGEAQRVGLMKLIAGMLGVGLDDLLQRETTRRQRRLAMLAAASLAGMAITSTLAITAIQARNEAREQRREAEGLVAYMLGDLKDKLEPIGRLDALDGVGSRVLAYYGKQDTTKLSDDALLQRSRALTLMGQVANLRGNTAAAMRSYREAMAGTAEAVRRNPSDPQRLYDHAQNIFWVGSLYHQAGDLASAEAAMRQYKALGKQMVALGPDNMKWRAEEQDADANLGIVLYERRQFSEAAIQLQQAAEMLRAFATADPRNDEYQQNLADILAWVGDAEMGNGELDKAIAVREQQVALLKHFVAQPNSDVAFREKLLAAEEALGRFYAYRGRSDLALQHLRAAVDVANALIPIEPANTLWLNYALAARDSLAWTLLAKHQVAEASAETDATCAIAQTLLSRESKSSESRAAVNACLSRRAEIAQAMGRNDEAQRIAQRAIALAATVKTSDPADAKYALSKDYRLLGDSERALGNSQAASEAWRNALNALPKDVAEKPAEMDQHAVVLQRLGRAAEAQAITAKLNAIGYQGRI